MPEPMEIILTTQVVNAASQTTLDLSGLITAMQSSGMSNDAIKTVLMNDLRSGGRIFGSFRNSLKNTTKNGVEYSSNQAQKNVYTDAKVPKFQWVSVGDNSVCSDCQRRHGQIEPMEYWETVGLPKSGFSICQTNCRCPMPVPESYTGENLDKPLLRKEKKKLPVTVLKMAGKHETVQDSIKWLETNVANKVTFSQITDIEIANAITLALAKNYKKYNLNKLDKIIVSRRGRRWASAAGTELNIHSATFTKKGLKKIYQDAVPDYLKDWKAALADSQKQLRWTKKNLSTKPELSGMIPILEARIRRIEKTLKEKKQYGRSHVFDKNDIAGSIINHEMGHVIHDQFTGKINRGNRYSNLKNPAITAEVRKKWNDEWIGIWDKVKREGITLSEYASINNNELFAEAFAMYVGGEKAKLPKIIKDFLDRYLAEFS